MCAHSGVYHALALSAGTHRQILTFSTDPQQLQNALRRSKVLLACKAQLSSSIWRVHEHDNVARILQVSLYLAH